MEATHHVTRTLYYSEIQKSKSSTFFIISIIHYSTQYRLIRKTRLTVHKLMAVAVVFRRSLYPPWPSTTRRRRSHAARQQFLT